MKIYPQVHIGTEDEVHPVRTWRNELGTTVTMVKLGDVWLVGEPHVLDRVATEILAAAVQATIDDKASAA